MSNDTKAQCNTCHYWEAEAKDTRGQGTCHRYPIALAGIVPQPSMIPGQVLPAVISAFPNVPSGNWCGEHLASSTVLLATVQ